MQEDQDRPAYYAFDSSLALWYWLSSDENYQGPCSSGELYALAADGKIADDTVIVHKFFPKNRYTFRQLKRHNTRFSFGIDDFAQSRLHRTVTILSGPNNCGKSLLLKALYYRLGEAAYFLPCGRFDSVSHLSYSALGDSRSFYTSFSQSFLSEQQNTENNRIKLNQLLTTLTTDRRNLLFTLAKELLGMTFTIERADPDNYEFSPMYVAVDGEPLAYSSTGTRLVLTLLGICLNKGFSVLLIDEPELGLNPAVQSIIADLLLDGEMREKHLGHLRHTFIATHSHVFLDRKTIANNIKVVRNDNIISVSEIGTHNELHQLQFNLLGNRLEALFLPSAIVVVEGESDQIFLRRVLLQKLPDSRISVIRAEGEGRILEKIRTLEEAFGEVVSSPYRSRLFVVLDAGNSVRVDRLHEKGLLQSNIQVWSGNGIEYVYPKKAMSAIFFASEDYVVGNLRVDKVTKRVEMNGIVKDKVELARQIEEKIGPSTQYDEELENLVSKIRSAIGVG